MPPRVENIVNGVNVESLTLSYNSRSTRAVPIVTEAEDVVAGVPKW
jgi:hypothetical protein